LTNFDGQNSGSGGLLTMAMIAVGLVAVGFMAYRRRQHGR
jgi:putative exporter of polyketide antibiotics